MKLMKLVNQKTKNVTFRIVYQDKDKNITKEEVAKIRKQIIEKLEKEFGAKLVGKV